MKFLNGNDLGYKFLKLWHSLWLATRFLAVHLQDFYLLGSMKKLVYQRKVVTQGALLCHIWDAADHRKDNHSEIMWATHLTHKLRCVLRLRVVILNSYFKSVNKNFTSYLWWSLWTVTVNSWIKTYVFITNKYQSYVRVKFLTGMTSAVSFWSYDILSWLILHM